MQKLTKCLSLLSVLLLLAQAPAWAAPRAYSEELDQAMAMFHEGNFEESIPLFEAAFKKDPQNTLAITYLLHAHYKKKTIQEVVTKFERRAVARGEDPTAATHLGLAYFLRGMMQPEQLNEALTEFKQAVRDDPNLAIAHTGIGMVYFQKRMMPRSKNHFIKALRLNPHDVMALDRLGNILLIDEENPQGALELFQRTIQELPSYPDGHYYVGSSLFNLKKYDEAVPHLLKARELDPKGITMGFEAASLLGSAYMKIDRKAEAIEAFEAALKIRPESKYIDIKLRQAKGEEV